MTPIDSYLAYLDKITGNPDPKFIPSPFTEGPRPPVFAITYEDFPEFGLMTSFTSGLSFVKHEDWPHYRPELILTVRSQDTAWPLSLAFIAHQARGKFPFPIGDTIDFRAEMSQESKMSGYFIAQQTTVPPDNQIVHVEGWHIMFHQLIPIYQGELQKLRIDHQWLNGKEFDPFDVVRPDMSLTERPNKSLERTTPAPLQSPGLQPSNMRNWLRKLFRLSS